MPILSKPANAAYLSIVYITLGAIMDVWTLVWYLYLRHTGYDGPAYYVCLGVALTGFTLLAIGFSIGQIGRAARHAELPPEEVAKAQAQVAQTAAAHPPVVMSASAAIPANPAANPVRVATPTQAPVAQPVPAPPVRG